jgi:hypothetical protein
VADVRIFPEPHVRFGGVLGHTITRARSAWGHDYCVAHDPQPLEAVSVNRLRVGRRNRSDVLAKPPDYEQTLTFLKPPLMHGETDQLDLRGSIHAQVWSERKAIACIETLNPTDEAETVGAQVTKFKVFVDPQSPNNPDSLIVNIMVDWNPKLIGFSRQVEADPVWIVNQPAAVAKPELNAKAPRKKPVADAHGMIFLDTNGEPLEASIQLASLRVFRDSGQTLWSQNTLKYSVRTTTGKPLRTLGKVIFSAHELEAFPIPFVFQQAPVAVGLLPIPEPTRSPDDDR